jgi:hypothetical protein
MAAEAPRGCGYRKVGGLYLAADPTPGIHCCKIPFELHVCPTCHAGIKQSRGWTWIDPRPFLDGPCKAAKGPMNCPFQNLDSIERAGLLWVGAASYPTPGDFSIEVARMGLSKRIKAVPRDYKLGTWVLFAHPRVFPHEYGYVPGVFLAVQPSRVEKIVTDIMAKDTEAMAALEKRGITPVIVPWNDPDHAGKEVELGKELELV